MSEIGRYPYAGIASSTDYFRIEIYTVSGAGNLGGGGSLTGVAGTGTSVGAILLPMPSNIQDGNSVSYGEDQLGAFTEKGLGVAQKAMGTTIQEVMKADTTKLETATNKALDLITNAGFKDVVMKSLAAEAVSIFGGNVSINSLLARESGQIINPNLELLFSGVTLRSFRFSFKMTPRSDTETSQIKNIIRALKKNMAPSQTTDFLTTPNLFQIKYMKGNNEHPFLHKFKTCFLKDMSVNYTGENVYATYHDGTPVSLNLDLTFQEREPIYASDYAPFSNEESDPGLRGVGF